jgi:hypothetical protein
LWRIRDEIHEDVCRNGFDPALGSFVQAYGSKALDASLAREASTSGDRVAAENLYQHAEHYFRVMNAANEGHQHGVKGPTAAAELQTEVSEEEGSDMAGHAWASSDRQPYST